MPKTELRRTGLRFEIRKSDKLEGMSPHEAREQIVTIAIPIIEQSWRAAANQRLSKRQAAIYTAAIRISAFRGTSASLTLQGSAANDIEFGAPSWDMKPGLLKGASSRVIGFTHASYRAKGKFGQPMGAPYKRYFGEEAAHGIGRRVYEAATKLGMGQAMRNAPAPLLQEHHKSSIYEGMYRFTDAGRGRGIAGVGYQTYRTVSINSPANSWIYPAMPASNIIDDAIDEAAPEIQEAVGALFGEAIIKVRKGKGAK